jgi:peptidylprolyl isomerase
MDLMNKLTVFPLCIDIIPTDPGAGEKAFPASTKASPSGKGKTRMIFETTLGQIIIELAEDMPITAGNFETLVRDGFYNGVTFHRVIDGFMVQGGDPTGTGRGGPGYMIRDEFGRLKNRRGTIAMANAGPNTGGSQFFINLVNNSHLDGKHPVFGTVIVGMDVVDRIGNTRTDRNDRPITDIKIIRAAVNNDQ